ncbi:hypothetical protein [Synechococcus elongatus]|uniref:Uncharacterized protein n=1 Tax=Synechococcus elongatus PCC 11801 TaxID=2219813 RepID=A0AAN1UU94_SYNEL|nr:hypothetical protein [Synechococcus elongatus]
MTASSCTDSNHNPFAAEVEAFIGQMAPQEGPGLVLCRGHELFYFNAEAIARCPDPVLREDMASSLATLDPAAEYLICLFDGQNYQLQRCAWQEPAIE